MFPSLHWTVVSWHSGVRQNPLLVLILCCAASSGCAVFEADKLYKSGTNALEQGDYPQCIEQLEKAKALLPNASSVIRNNLGVCYDRVGRKKDAWVEFRKAVINSHQNNAALKNFRASWADFMARGVLTIGAAADTIVDKLGEPDFRKKADDGIGDIWGYGNDQFMVIWARKTLEIRDQKVSKMDQ